MAKNYLDFKNHQRDTLGPQFGIYTGVRLPQNICRREPMDFEDDLGIVTYRPYGSFWTIYQLFYPTETPGEKPNIFYVGLSKDPYGRYLQHIHSAIWHSSEKDKLIFTKMSRKRILPEMEAITTTYPPKENLKQARQLEAHFMLDAEKRGFKLLNIQKPYKRLGQK